jgi:hypothetical protein
MKLDVEGVFIRSSYVLSYLNSEQNFKAFIFSKDKFKRLFQTSHHSDV